MKVRLLMAGMLLIGCKSVVGPLHGDVYVLESIAGAALPAPFAQNLQLNDRVFADTLAFESEAGGERRWVYEVGPESSERRVERNTFTYTRNGNRIAIEFRCPDNASCIAPPHLVGTLSENGLTITESRVSRQPLVFRKISSP